MKCLEKCIELDVSCPNNDCRAWINSEAEYNCIHEAVSQQGAMTLREAAKRLNVSFVRVKQIEDKAIKKLGKIKNFKTI
tara:strand:+ start:4073 stop:4309 length:237 start_codon:yes stop_codon:yes gene_type:complete